MFGWVGAITVLVAYGLVSFKKVSVDGVFYHVLNIIGAVGLGANVFAQGAWPSFSLQCIWGFIAVIAIIGIIRRKYKR